MQNNQTKLVVRKWEQAAAAFFLSRRLTHTLCTAVLSLSVLTGCEMNDPMIQEMDSAYEAVVQRQKQDKAYYDPNTDNTNNKEQSAAVTRVVQKYFPPGMKVEEALKLLHLLKDKGFEIHENQLEGARSWPDGELKPYRDQTTKQKRLALDPTGRMISYTARKRYERQVLIFEKHAFITIYTDGKKIVSTEGRIWPQTNVP